MEDLNKPAVSTLEEVKKLQDLVRKLELQNQQLRNKHNKVPKKNSLTSSKDISKHSPVNNILKLSNSSNIEDKNYIGNNNKYGWENDMEHPGDISNENANYMDEIDIIRVSDVEMSDDDSWLYISPKGLTPEQKNESPYKWLRKDVDDPDNKELQLAKKALITKLNELEILSPTSQVSPTQHINRTINQLRKPLVPYKSPSPTHEPSHYSGIDTRTFTKSKKKQALEYLSSSPIAENCRDFERKELCRRGSDISLDSSTGTYTLTDASDVQEVARMQEESLRLSSPIGTPKRQSVASGLSSRRMSISSRSSISDHENTEQSLTRQMSEESNHEPITTTPTSAIHVEPSVHSDQSSPSESPYGSNMSLNNAGREKGEMYRGSLPNLNRAPRGFKSRKSAASEESRQQKKFATKTNASGRKSDSNLLSGNKLTRRVESPTGGIVSPPRRMMSPTRRMVSPTRRMVSPTRQKSKQPGNPGPPTTSGSLYYQSREYSSRTTKVTENIPRLPPKSGLPRPMRATSATRAGSGIPMPSMTAKKIEDSWNDGCF